MNEVGELPRAELSPRELLQFIQPGRTVKDVVKRTGYKGPLIPFVKDVIAAWHEGNRPHAELSSKRLLAERDRSLQRDASGVPVLPTEDVSVNDASVSILGVKHSQPGDGPLETPYGYAVRDFVKSKIKLGQQWFFEQYLQKDFKLDDIGTTLTDYDTYKELSYHRRAGKSIVRQLLNVRKIVKQEKQERLNTATMTEAQVYEFTKLLGEDAMNTPEGIALYQRYRDAVSLPEPFNLEAVLLIDQGEDGKGSSLRVDRSFIQARQVLQRILDPFQRQRRLGVVVGDGHRSHVKYFLSNPYYYPYDSVAEARQLASGGGKK